jgi:hypothetical protein
MVPLNYVNIFSAFRRCLYYIKIIFMPFGVISYFCYWCFITYWNEIGVLHSIWDFVFTILPTYPVNH